MFLQLKLDIQIYEEERMTPNLGKCQKIKRLSPHCWPELGWEISYILHILVIIRGEPGEERGERREERGESVGWVLAGGDIDSLAGGSHHIPRGRPAETRRQYQRPHLEI